MKKRTKTILALVMAAMMTAACCSCGSSGSQTAAENKADEGTTNATNPVHECSQEKMAEKTGLSLEAPEGATKVTYAWIGDKDDKDGTKTAQVDFSLDNKQYEYRATATSVTDITQTADGQENEEDLTQALSDGSNCGAALAGYYENWECGATTTVSERDAVIAYTKKGSGFVAWVDVVPGILYSLSMDKRATEDLLMDTAEACFVPTQD